MEDLNAELDRSNSQAASLDKKQKNFDKILAEHKCKTEELSVDLVGAQKEVRQIDGETFTVKNALEESLDNLESSKREKKILEEEVSELNDQIQAGFGNIFSFWRIYGSNSVNLANTSIIQM